MPLRSNPRNKKKTALEPAPLSTLVAESVAVDYPQEDELIVPGHYAVRVSAVPGAQVEISINGGEWQLCREAVGFYWHDWQADLPGSAHLEARARVGKGRWKKSGQRNATIVGSGQN